MVHGHQKIWSLCIYNPQKQWRCISYYQWGFSISIIMSIIFSAKWAGIRKRFLILSVFYTAYLKTRLSSVLGITRSVIKGVPGCRGCYSRPILSNNSQGRDTNVPLQRDASWTSRRRPWTAPPKPVRFNTGIKTSWILGRIGYLNTK